MSEEHNADRSEPVNRRKVLSMLGATGVGIAGVGSAAASGMKTDTTSDVQRASRKEKQRSIPIARQSSEFKSLKKFINQDTGEHVTTRDAEAITSLDDDEKPYTVVSFDGQDDQSNKDTEVNIAVAIRDKEILAARGARTIFESDGRPDIVQTFEIQDGEVTKESGKVETQSGEGTVTTQISLCRYCKEAKRAACSVGCGLGTGAICLALSLAPPASIACTGIAAAVCYAISRAGGCQISARYACSYGKNDYC